MAAIAFFDLDRTLICRNSAVLWLWDEIRAGNVGLYNALRGAAWIIRYRLGADKMEKAVEETIAAMKGRSEKEMQERTEQFYERIVRPNIRPGARAAIDMHRREGDKLVLLTSSSKYVSYLVARDLAFDHYFATELEVDAEGLFTGKPHGQPCFGPGKLVAARCYAAMTRIDLNQCTFYTDSASDLPVLEAVGHPVAVNADIRLTRIARARGWSIVDWGKPITTEQCCLAPTNKDGYS